MLYNGVWEKSMKSRQQSLPRRPGKRAGVGEKLTLGQTVAARDEAVGCRQWGSGNYAKLISAEVSKARHSSLSRS